MFQVSIFIIIRNYDTDMKKSIQIPFNPDINAIIDEVPGKFGIILAHNLMGSMEDPILVELTKKLIKNGITVFRFNFPKNTRNTPISELEPVFMHVWNWVNTNYNKYWILAGHGTAAKIAVRIAPILDIDGEIPAIIGLNYPLYPPNKPEMADVRELGALLGDALFCQGTRSNRGDYMRMQNSIKMMANHAIVKSIKDADFDFKINGRFSSKVSAWISSDIVEFLKEISNS